MAQSSYLSLGGKGLNQAVASKRLSKNEVFFLSVLGDDFLSKFVLKNQSGGELIFGSIFRKFDNNWFQLIDLSNFMFLYI